MGQLVGQVAALGDLDRVDLADQVGDGDVRRRQLLAVPAVARQIQSIGRRVALSSTIAFALGRSARRIIVHLAAADDRDRFIEQLDQQPGEASLGLAALTEEDDVLAGHDRVLDRGQDRLVIADDPADDRPIGRESGEKV